MIPRNKDGSIDWSATNLQDIADEYADRALGALVAEGPAGHRAELRTLASLASHWTSFTRKEMDRLHAEEVKKAARRPDPFGRQDCANSECDGYGWTRCSDDACGGSCVRCPACNADGRKPRLSDRKADPRVCTNPRCDGNGWTPCSSEFCTGSCRPCKRCNPTGERARPKRPGRVRDPMGFQHCSNPNCDGYGWVWGDRHGESRPCTVCNPGGDTPSWGVRKLIGEFPKEEER